MIQGWHSVILLMSYKMNCPKVVVVAFLNIVSSPDPGFVNFEARFGQLGD